MKKLLLACVSILAMAIPVFAYADVVDQNSCLEKYPEAKMEEEYMGCDTRLSCNSPTLKALEVDKFIGVYRLKSKCSVGHLPEEIEVNYKRDIYVAFPGHCGADIRLNGEFEIQSKGQVILSASSINNGYRLIDNPWASSDLRAISAKYSSFFGINKTLSMNVRACTNNNSIQVISNCALSPAQNAY